MKGIAHLIAALFGLTFAALIVTFVFGSADEGGSRQSGEAPDSSAYLRCPAFEPDDVTSKKAIRRATASLPAVYKVEGKTETEIEVTDAAQRAWVARVHAALGGCTDEIQLSLRPSTLVVTAGFPKKTSNADIGRYTYSFLEAAFSPPLSRGTVQLTITQGKRQRRVGIVSAAWRGFERGRAAYDLPPTIDGLRRFRRQVGYGREIRFEGWASGGTSTTGGDG